MDAYSDWDSLARDTPTAELMDRLFPPASLTAPWRPPGQKQSQVGAVSRCESGSPPPVASSPPKLTGVALYMHLEKEGAASPYLRSHFTEKETSLNVPRGAARYTALSAASPVEAYVPQIAAPPLGRQSSREAFKEEYLASAELQGEFPTVEAYVALRAAETQGRIKVIAPGAGQQGSRRGSVVTEADRVRWRAEWSASPALQAEFTDCCWYVAFREGETLGRIKVHAPGGAAR